MEFCGGAGAGCDWGEEEENPRGKKGEKGMEILPGREEFPPEAAGLGNDVGKGRKEVTPEYFLSWKTVNLGSSWSGV